MFQQITSPGLPTWPRLMFDANTKNAKVTMRLATWRSHEHGLSMTKFIVFLSVFLLGIVAYELAPKFVDPVVRIASIFFIYLALVAVIPRLLLAALPGVLARQIFAERVSLWFTPKAIGFRSRLYEQGVIFWREWKEKPVQLQFSMAEDWEAQRHIDHRSHDRQGPKFHLQSAKMLCAYIRVAADPRANPNASASHVARAIPISEIAAPVAERVIVVCNAAQLLTAHNHQRSTTQRPLGRDIDA